MAMRSQVVEAKLDASEIAALRSTGGSVSVFTQLFNRIMTTQATEFVVIEHIGSSPLALSKDDTTAGVLTRAYNGYVQIKINTTEYFLYPDGSRTPGIPNLAAPYPINVAYQPSFVLYPDIYVLPGQRWDVLFNLGDDDALTEDEYVYVFLKYTLYDGTDAVLANQLLEMGITVKPANIDWLKRKLIERK